MFDLDYSNPYGLWRVSTSTLNEDVYLGTYVGNAGEIAERLSDHKGECLIFQKTLGIPAEPNLENVRRYFTVELPYASGIRDLSKEERIPFIQNLFCGHNGLEIYRARNTYTGGVELRYTDARWAEMQRQKALSKLTKEERLCLGLWD